MKESFEQRRKQLKKLDQLTRLRTPAKRRELSDPLFCACRRCGEASAKTSWAKQSGCCPICGFHERIGARARLTQILDPGYSIIDEPAVFRDPLKFPSYAQKWQRAAELSGVDEAILFAVGTIDGESCVVGAMDSLFLMGSMGQTVGERIVKAFAYAVERELPVVIFATSGGARMQEAIHSLMQMRRTADAVRRFQKRGNLFISVLTDPTTGGVTASFASLGNIILAEPDALIGFAGPRVIKETIQCDLPPGFQRAEFLQANGLIDAIVSRREMRRVLFELLRFHNPSKRNGWLDRAKRDLSDDTKRFSGQEPNDRVEEVTAFARVQAARDPKRISPREILAELCTNCFELSGDRLYADDPSIRCGLAYLDNLPITYVITDKGANLDEQIKHRFGMPQPEGYRKAERMMREAERFGRPILTIVDTPGAYPGIEAEERGQGEAIARNLWTMSDLRVPVITLISGEAGSGGALAIACADRLYMLENAIYTILSPEGFATILWKDKSRAAEAAEYMKLTASDMLAAGVCQGIFPDDLTGLRDELIEQFSKLNGRLVNE